MQSYLATLLAISTRGESNENNHRQAIAIR